MPNWMQGSSPGLEKLHRQLTAIVEDIQATESYPLNGWGPTKSLTVRVRDCNQIIAGLRLLSETATGMAIVTTADAAAMVKAEGER